MEKEQHMSDSQGIRTRTISWHNPLESAEQGRQLSGLEYPRVLQSGEVLSPPIMALMDSKLNEIEEGRVVLSIEPAEFHYNPRLCCKNRKKATKNGASSSFCCV
jgi:hypothetical protein